MKQVELLCSYFNYCILWLFIWTDTTHTHIFNCVR